MSIVHSIRSNDGTLYVVCDGEQLSVTTEHPNYHRVCREIENEQSDFSVLKELIDIKRAILKVQDGKVEFDLENETIKYDDVEFHDKDFCNRVLRLMKEGQDIQYLVNFLKNVGENPSYRAMMETFKFICNEGMPITSDGCFLGYKGLNDNYYDVYTNTVDNTPDGREISMPRKDVDDNSSIGCSHGYHVGSYRYAKGWAKGKIILVKVNPRDVVSVPNHECEKMRVCKYTCVSDISDMNSPLEGEVYDGEGNRVPANTFANQKDLEDMFFDTARVDSYEGRTYCEDLSDSYFDDYEDYDYEDDDYEDYDYENC